MSTSKTDDNEEADTPNEEESSHAKRPATEETSEPTAKRSCNATEESAVLDLAETLKYKAGDRFEVKWEVSKDEEDDNMIEHWWPATLLQHDGRTIDSVAIRVLEYDPFPEGGFPERSQEGVIFMGRDTLVDPETSHELTYRRAGEEGLIALTRDNIEEIVNSTIKSALAKSSEAWSRLAPAQQAIIASGVAEKKKKLVELFLTFQGRIISDTDVQSILMKTMQDDRE